MNKHSILFIGLDTHKEFNEVAYIEEHRGAQPVHLGRVSSSKVAVQKLVRQFESKYPGSTLHFVYEAGPCGYWIYRLITSLGHCCYVVAPSLIPKRPGEKIKTDKRDALKLAKLLKSEDLTPIYVPEPEDEAVRDLSRAREVAMKDLKDAKYQLKALLLRNNINYKALQIGHKNIYVGSLSLCFHTQHSTSFYKSFYTRLMNEQADLNA